MTVFISGGGGGGVSYGIKSCNLLRANFFSD